MHQVTDLVNSRLDFGILEENLEVINGVVANADVPAFIG